MIPRICHFYWGARVMPYIRYMTIKSFVKYNKQWTIKLYTPSVLSDRYNWPGTENKWQLTTRDYSDRLKDLGITHEIIDFETIGISNELPEVTKSDFLRLHLLSTVGGVWSDMDIVYFKPVESTFNLDNHFSTYLCYNPMPWGGVKFHSIGFIMASYNNPTFRKLCIESHSSINNYDYQAIGSPFYERFVNMSDHDVYNMPYHVVYPIHPFDHIWRIKASETIDRIQPDTIGVHWYAGYKTSGEFQNLLTEDNYKNYDNIVTHYLRQVCG